MLSVSLGAELFFVCFAASVLGGILGMASGIFVVPALTLLFGINIRLAVGASLVSVIACSCGSATSAMENRLTNVRLAIVLEIGTTLGALSGVVLAGVFSSSALYLLFALILFASAQQMFRRREGGYQREARREDPWARYLGLNSSYPDPISRQEVSYGVSCVWLGIILMYVAGAVSALLGIGSGVLKVPAMDSALRLPIKVSSATSNFMIGVTAAASAGIYYMRGDIIPTLAAPVALGSVSGAYLGSKIMMRTSAGKIRLLFIGVLILLGAKMFWTALGGLS